MIAYEQWTGEAVSQLLETGATHHLAPAEVEQIACEAQRHARIASPHNCAVQPSDVGAAWETWRAERYVAAREMEASA